MKKKLLLLLLCVLCLVPISVSAADTIQYVALGDSISTGYGLDTSEGEVGFVDLFAEDTGYSAAEVYNAAKNGATIEDVELLFLTNAELEAAITDADDLASAKNSAAVVQAAVAEAEVVTLTVGGNDLLEVLYAQTLAVMQQNDSSITLADVKKGLASGDTTYIMAAYQALGSATLSTSIAAKVADYSTRLENVLTRIRTINNDVVIIIATQYNPYYAFKDTLYYLLFDAFADATEVLNKAIENAASAASAIVADVNAKLNEASYLNASASPVNIDVHPNASGHALIANTFDDAWTREVTISLKPYPDSDEIRSCVITEGDPRLLCAGENPVRDGYELMGYYSAEAGGVKVVEANLNLVVGASGYTDASASWIGDNNLKLYGVWQEDALPVIEICDILDATHCTEVTGSNNDILGDGKIAYDATKKVLTIKNTTLEKDVYIYEDDVEVILDNAKVIDTTGDYYTLLESHGKNITITIKGNSTIEYFDSYGYDSNIIIRGTGTLNVSGIYASDNASMQIAEGVTVNAAYISSYGLLTIKGEVNAKADDNSSIAIESDKIIFAKTAKVTIDGYEYGVYAFGDYDEFLDNTNSIVIENGATVDIKNTDIAMVVWTYFADSPLAGNKVIVLPEDYIGNNYEIALVADTVDEGYYYYSLVKKGGILEVVTTNGASTVKNAVGNVRFIQTSTIPVAPKPNPEAPAPSEKPGENTNTSDKIAGWVITLIASLGIAILSAIKLRRCN